MGEANFQPNGEVTDSILKSQFVQKNGNDDIVNITAHSFAGIDRVDYISVYGRDGYYHDVPVPWIEYEPISTTRAITVKRGNSATSDENKNNNVCTFLHTLFAKIL